MKIGNGQVRVIIIELFLSIFYKLFYFVPEPVGVPLRGNYAGQAGARGSRGKGISCILKK